MHAGREDVRTPHRTPRTPHRTPRTPHRTPTMPHIHHATHPCVPPPRLTTRAPCAGRYTASGQYDGPDWDTPEAYKGGALPDWSDVDPALSGKGARVFPYGKEEAVK